MNILISSASYIFSDHLPGGEYQIAHAIVSRLARKGHQVHVISPRKQIRQDIPNVTIHEIGKFNFPESRCYWQYYLKWWTYAYRSYWKAASIVKSHQIDIIHHLRPAYHGRFSLCGRLPGPFVYGPLSLPWETKSPQPDTRWQRSSIFDPILNRILDRMNMTAGNRLWQKTFEQADVIPISVTKTKTHIPEADHHKTTMIPLGVDAKQFVPPSVPTRDFEILFVGVLEYRKGLDFLLRAMPQVLKRLPQTRLTLVGKGVDEDHYKTLAKDLGIESNTHFVGSVPFDQILPYYQRCHVFCLPSLGEPFGISLLQAMACAKPIVSTQSGGVPEFVIDGQSGLLVPQEDPEALTVALTRVLEDETFCQSCEEFNRQQCIEKYDWDVVVNQIEDVYAKLLNS